MNTQDFFLIRNHRVRERHSPFSEKRRQKAERQEEVPWENIFLEFDYVVASIDRLVARRLVELISRMVEEKNIS